MGLLVVVLAHLPGADFVALLRAIAEKEYTSAAPLFALRGGNFTVAEIEQQAETRRMTTKAGNIT